MSNRDIKTKYYIGKNYAEPIRTNSSSDANKAVATAVLHMQVNHYGATVAEVYDSHTGELHALIRRSIGNSSIQILYKRDPSKYETKIAIGAIL